MDGYQESIEDQMRIAKTVAEPIIEEAFADIRDAATSTTNFVVQSFQVVEPADSRMGCAHAIRMFLERLALEEDISVGVIMNKGCLQLTVQVLSINVLFDRQITYAVH